MDTSLFLYSASENWTIWQGQWKSNSNWCSTGYTLGASIGYKRGTIDQDQTIRVSCFVGDDTFQSHATSLSTMARYGLDIVVVIILNQNRGMSQMAESARPYQSTPGPYKAYNTFTTPTWDYVKLAEAFGGNVATIDNTSDFDDGIVETIKENTDPTFYLLVCTLGYDNDYPQTCENYVSDFS